MKLLRCKDHPKTKIKRRYECCVSINSYLQMQNNGFKIRSFLLKLIKGNDGDVTKHHIEDTDKEALMVTVI